MTETSTLTANRHHIAGSIDAEEVSEPLEDLRRIALELESVCQRMHRSDVRRICVSFGRKRHLFHIAEVSHLDMFVLVGMIATNL